MLNPESNVLCSVMTQKSNNYEKTTMVWDLMQKILDEKTLKQKLLAALKVKKGFEYFFQSFILSTCVKNESHETFLLWFEIVSKFSFKFIQDLMETVEDEHENPEAFFSSLASFRDGGRSVVDCALHNRDKRVRPLLDRCRENQMEAEKTFQKSLR
jgi:hypothetical protein